MGDDPLGQRRTLESLVSAGQGRIWAALLATRPASYIVNLAGQKVVIGRNPEDVIAFDVIHWKDGGITHLGHQPGEDWPRFVSAWLEI